MINKLGLNLSYEGLVDKITIDNPKDTRILSITAQDPSPQMAKNIADSVATTASEYIGDIMEMVPPKIIEEGVVPARKSSPSNAKNAVMGAAAGMILVCAIVTLQVVLNDTIQSEEDIEKYLNLTVLASVPLPLEEATQKINMVVEGVPTAKGAYALMKAYEIEMPIIEGIYEVLFENYSVQECVQKLMNRDKKMESFD